MQENFSRFAETFWYRSHWSALAKAGRKVPEEQSCCCWVFMTRYLRRQPFILLSSRATACRPAGRRSLPPSEERPKRRQHTPARREQRSVSLHCNAVHTHSTELHSVSLLAYMLWSRAVQTMPPWGQSRGTQLRSLFLCHLFTKTEATHKMPNEQSTFTGWASVLIFPQDTASSGLAPESEPSNSWPVFTNTA